MYFQPHQEGQMPFEILRASQSREQCRNNCPTTKVLPHSCWNTAINLARVSSTYPAGRIDAIVHVDTKRSKDDQIERMANAHEISGFGIRQGLATRIDDFPKVNLGFSARQSTNRIPRRTSHNRNPARQALFSQSAHLGKQQCALDNWE
jgi:hypothetical protein